MHKGYMLGFELVSGVVKVFPVSFVSLAGNRPGTTLPNDEMASQVARVTSPRGQDMYLYMYANHEERSRDQYEIPFRHRAASFLVDFLAKQK